MNHQHLIQMELAAYVAGRLDESSRRQVAEHLAQCDLCRGMVESLRVLAGHLRSDGEALFAPHPSGEELREFARKGPAGSSERIAGHLKICASCTLEVEAWSRMGEKPAASVSAEGITGPRRRGGMLGREMRTVLAAAAGIVLGIALTYLARERLGGLSPGMPPPVSQPRPEKEPPQGLPRIGPQLLLPRPLRGETGRLVYALQPRQDAVILACPAGIPQAAAPDARFRFELAREGGELAWSQEMTASEILEHRERTGVVTLLMRADVVEPGFYEFRLIDVGRPEGPLYRMPLEFTRLSGEAP